jgi:hypothetical protein
MRSLYRSLFVHLDSLWRFSYLTNTIIDACFPERRGFVIEGGTICECGCAVLARRREMNPTGKAA